MDWTHAIEKNRDALARIVAGWLALLAWVPGAAMPKVLPSHTRRKIAHGLPAAEAALRRLIVLFVQVNKIKPPEAKSSKKPLPDFSTFNREKKTVKPPRFRLIDPRKPLVFGVTLEAPKESNPFRNTSAGVPRIRFFDDAPPLVPLFAIEASSPAIEEKPHADPVKLINRLAALDHALNTIPQQAKRLARLMERRTKKPPGPGRVGPIRPGHPPGWEEPPRKEVQNVLRECHGLLTDRVVPIPDPP